LALAFGLIGSMQPQWAIRGRAVTNFVPKPRLDHLLGTTHTSCAHGIDCSTQTPGFATCPENGIVFRRGGLAAATVWERGCGGPVFFWGHPPALLAGFSPSPSIARDSARAVNSRSSSSVTYRHRPTFTVLSSLRCISWYPCWTVKPLFSHQSANGNQGSPATSRGLVGLRGLRCLVGVSVIWVIAH